MYISGVLNNINTVPLKKSINKNINSINSDRNSHSDICFGGYRDLVKNTVKLGKEISTQEEYDKVLNRIYKYKQENKHDLFDFETNKKLYPKVPKNQEGILLYAGAGDLSNDINRYLSGRKMINMKPSQAPDVIRVLDYSLKDMDNEYGKYSGIVYRQGFFPILHNQFISTTTDPMIAATLRGGIYMDKKLQFSIINAKSGHKINEFQRKMGSEYAYEEEEILLSRHSNFKEIINPKGELLFLKSNFHNLLEKYSHCEIPKSQIKVFEEL